jgi:hypothetical protein
MGSPIERKRYGEKVALVKIFQKKAKCPKENGLHKI